MPVAIRANSAQRHTGRVSAIVCACLMATVSAATAQNAVGGIPATARDMITRVPWHDVAGLALTLGVVLFAVISAIALLRTRQRAAVEAAGLRNEIDALKARPATRTAADRPAGYDGVAVAGVDRWSSAKAAPSPPGSRNAYQTSPPGRPQAVEEIERRDCVPARVIRAAPPAGVQNIRSRWRHAPMLPSSQAISAPLTALRADTKDCNTTWGRKLTDRGAACCGCGTSPAAWCKSTAPTRAQWSGRSDDVVAGRIELLDAHRASDEGGVVARRRLVGGRRRVARRARSSDAEQ